MPKVTILILTWNALEYTQACLESIQRHTQLDSDTQVLLVDNGSTDGTLRYLRRLGWIRLLENRKNLGFVRGNNIGIAATPDGDILLLNNDTVIQQDDWLPELQRVAYADEHTGIVGCRMILPDGRLLHAGTYMPLDSFWGQQIGSLEKDVNQYNGDRPVQSVVGACMYIRRAVLDAIGPLSEAYFSYFEDTDYCLTASESGLGTVCVGGVTLIHCENTSTKANRADFSKMFQKSQRIFRRRWERKLKARYDTSLVWHSEVGSPSGYAMSSRELILQLDALAVDVRLAYLYGTDWMDTQMDDHRIAAMRQRPKDLELPQVVYAPGEHFIKNSGRYRIGYTMLEVDGIPRDWARICNAMDEVWVPSHFNKEIFEASGVERPVKVMPLGVNPDYFNPHIRGYRATSRFSFLSVFEWGERKDPKTLLRAYSRAFNENDDVLLVLKVFNRDPSVDIKAAMRSIGLLDGGGPPIALLYNQELPRHQLGSLYRSADCFVLPTRGEGWGLPILEAMACGLPVIATDWSAQTEFLNDETGFPIQVKRLVPAKAKCPYYEGFRWAEADEEHLIYLMRYVYENRESAAEKGLVASERALTEWTWHRAAERIKSRLLELA